MLHDESYVQSVRSFARVPVGINAANYIIISLCSNFSISLLKKINIYKNQWECQKMMVRLRKFPRHDNLSTSVILQNQITNTVRSSLQY